MKFDCKLQKVLVAFFLVFLSFSMHAKIEKNSMLRYELYLPDDAVVKRNGPDSTTSIVAFIGNGFVDVNVKRVPDDEQVFMYRNVIKPNPIFNNPQHTIHYIEPLSPWWNLLRHERMSVEKIVEDGEDYYFFQKVDFRAKTLFYVRASCVADGYEECKRIMESFSSEYSTYSYFQTMRANIRWWQGSLYLTGIPLLASLTSEYWKRWGKKHEGKAKMLAMLMMIISMSLLSLPFVCLKDCLTLALIIFFASFAIWIVFFSGQKFLVNFINGIFG